MTDLNLPLVVLAAIVDGINPCAIGVLIFMLAWLIKRRHRHHTILGHGLIYILAVFLTYLAAGLILLPFLERVRGISVNVYYVLAGVVFVAGLLELKDFFFYGKGPTLSILPGPAKRIEYYIKHLSDRLSTSFMIGVFVSLVELPCTGAIYVAVLALMGVSGVTTTNLLLLLIYNLIFVLPLVAILLLFYQGISHHTFQNWHHRNRKYMRLAVGFMLIIMAAWMVLLVSG